MAFARVIEVELTAVFSQPGRVLTSLGDAKLFVK